MFHRLGLSIPNSAFGASIPFILVTREPACTVVVSAMAHPSTSALGQEFVIIAQLIHTYSQLKPRRTSICSGMLDYLRYILDR
jgi:hypothetical protein